MKLNRRKLFGVGAGAAVAGPGLARKALAEAQNMPMKGIGLADCAPSGPYPNKQSEGDWLRGRLSQMLKQRDEAASAKREPQFGAVEDQVRIESMRSLSESTKARMMQDAQWRANQRAQLSYIDREIAELKKKLGPLGGLL